MAAIMAALTVALLPILVSAAAVSDPPRAWIEFLSPLDNGFAAPTVEVRLRINTHDASKEFTARYARSPICFRLDGNAPNCRPELRGITLDGLKPGKHRIDAWLADRSHDQGGDVYETAAWRDQNIFQM